MLGGEGGYEREGKKRGGTRKEGRKQARCRMKGKEKDFEVGRGGSGLSWGGEGEEGKGKKNKI